jgi:superfamily I DNA and/or RNA helicase
MIVIGCADTFAKNTLWCKYIEHCKKKGVFVEGGINALVPSEFKSLAKEGETEEVVEDWVPS